VRAREVDWEEAAVMGLMETDGRGQRVSCTRKRIKSLRLSPQIEFELRICRAELKGTNQLSWERILLRNRCTGFRM
jgi:hypothetical protein